MQFLPYFQALTSRLILCRGNLTALSEADSAQAAPDPAPDPGLSPLDFLLHEAILAFFLLLLLVWFLNREFEVSYRLHYHGNVEADKHQLNIQNMRDQAEWLLGNIIPIHVAEQLKVGFLPPFSFFLFSSNPKYSNYLLKAHKQKEANYSFSSTSKHLSTFPLPFPRRSLS